MADQHNSNIPALTNQVAADIPDIKENLEFHKDAFQLLFETWSDTDNSSNVLDSALGFSNGTYTFDFPTNSVAAHAVIMCGNSSTIIWMYLNAAPPGWKVTATGKDTVLAVYADSGDYAVAGGSADTSATWTIDGITGAADTTHTHSHSHLWYDYKGTGAGDTDGSQTALTSVATKTSTSYYHLEMNRGTTAWGPDEDLNTDTNAAVGTSHNHAITEDGTWRPKASVGKLFQLDTA